MKHMSIEERLNYIQQANRANDVSIARYLASRDNNSLKAVIRRQTNIDRHMKTIVKDIIDRDGEF